MRDGGDFGSKLEWVRVARTKEPCRCYAHHATASFTVVDWICQLSASARRQGGEAGVAGGADVAQRWKIEQPAAAHLWVRVRWRMTLRLKPTQIRQMDHTRW